MLRPYLKDRLRENLVGAHVWMTDTLSTEILGSLGYDFLWVDFEHAEMTYTNLRNHLTASHAGGTPVVIRTQKDDYNCTKKILELGPDGIIFPMIETAEQADADMRYCLYPPTGVRGFGPLRAVRYGLDDIKKYLAEADEKTCRFAQIESERGVKNLPEIVKNPLIDAYVFGPNDLSGSIGEMLDVMGEHTVSLLREGAHILKECGKPAAVSTGSLDPEVLAFYRDMGFNIISSGTDYDYILRGAREHLARVRKVQGKTN